MKRLIPLLLLAAAAPAWSGNPCAAQPPLLDPDAPVQLPAGASAPGFRCAPAALGGTGTGVHVRNNAYGVTVWWYCQSPAGGWAPNWVVVTNEHRTAASVAGELQSMLYARSPLDALNATAVRTITLPLSDPSLARVWCPFQAEMFGSAPAAQ